jgi:drug/metabolite transporter (DMT)-like permease
LTVPATIFPVNRRLSAETPPSGWLDPYVLGTFCGLLAAFSYTCANAFLRAVHHCDPTWVSAIRAVPTVLIMSPVMGLMAARGQRVLPRPRVMLAVLAGGLVGQLVGNISFQWSLGEIGVALAVPLTLGGMIVSAAILGRTVLLEPITPRAALSLAILLTAIFVLSLGADDARRSVATSAAGPWRLAAGVAAACLAGVAYSVLNVILRHCTTRGAPLPATLLIVSLAGSISLSALAWMRIGPQGILATTPSQLAIMLAAGVCNTVGFTALTKSLQLTNVVYVNALNATQATLAALAGVLLFQEALSPWLAAGVLLTIAGLGSMAIAHRKMQEPAV